MTYEENNLSRWEQEFNNLTEQDKLPLFKSEIEQLKVMIGSKSLERKIKKDKDYQYTYITEDNKEDNFFNTFRFIDKKYNILYINSNEDFQIVDCVFKELVRLSDGIPKIAIVDTKNKTVTIQEIII